jgi:hypothetical protein
MKYLKTNLEGKVRNMPHFKGEALLPVFETVVNSIQAIEERGNLLSGEIEVQILRVAKQGTLIGDADVPAICDFNYAKLKGELGYYTYNRNLNAHTEILAFNKIVGDAKQRHKAFFEKLGIS